MILDTSSLNTYPVSLPIISRIFDSNSRFSKITALAGGVGVGVGGTGVGVGVAVPKAGASTFIPLARKLDTMSTDSWLRGLSFKTISISGTKLPFCTRGVISVILLLSKNIPSRN